MRTAGTPGAATPNTTKYNDAQSAYGLARYCVLQRDVTLESSSAGSSLVCAVRVGQPLFMAAEVQCGARKIRWSPLPSHARNSRLTKVRAPSGQWARRAGTPASDKTARPKFDQLRDEHRCGAAYHGLTRSSRRFRKVFC